MADQEEDDSEAQSSPKRAWVEALFLYAVMGGAYGAAIGTIIATLFLLFVRTLNALPHMDGNDRGNGFDAIFRR